MALLSPDWERPRPSRTAVQENIARLPITPVVVESSVLERFISQIRASHDQGGAHLVAFEIAPDPVFDWFASRSRLAEEGLLDCVFTRSVVQQVLPDLFRGKKSKTVTGLTWQDPFFTDGLVAGILHRGGAYSNATGDGRSEKALALEVCDAIFGLRFGEISCYISGKPWSPWFKNVAWDVTGVLFDKRYRKLWVFVVTDTD